MTLSLVPIPEASAEAVASLQRACFPEDPWDGACVGEIMRIAGCFGLTARAGRRPVGFALALDLSGECEILSLGVVPRMRRCGTGRALLAGICAEARQRGALCALLEVAADNRAARALYREFGFAAIGCRRKYYRRGGSFVDALVLRLALAGAPLPT
jgi:[ribosomal protein S18]-alanine N-acetyltransferase